MADTNLVNRLISTPGIGTLPREELEWLAEYGTFEVLEEGTVVGAEGAIIENLWIILSGYITIRVDRGTGLRRVFEWRTGEVTGKLPYSRMSGPPGDTVVDERAETLKIHESRFPELIHRCPEFTAHTVHVMVDRARSFKTSDLQDEKMISLGKLAAGLAHELNNPASAIVRSAKLMRESLSAADSAAKRLGRSGLSDDVISSIDQFRDRCLLKPSVSVRSPLEQADREDEISDWLVGRSVSAEHALPLADTAVTIDDLDAIADIIPSEELDKTLDWIAHGCVTNSLAGEIEDAATRIYDLVASVKKFTYMDQLSASDSVDVGVGLSDTIRILASKATSRGTAITLNIEPNLPNVTARGGELNQVWMNLIDNAIDAVDANGHIEIIASRDRNRVVVQVIDDGPGIDKDIMPRIFDPFFTTKPTGKGTGLGLEITRRLIRQCQGDISVESRPGRTEFRVTLLAE